MVADAFTSPWFDRPLDNVALAIVVLIGREIDQYAMGNVLDGVLFRIPNAKVWYGGRSDPEMNEGLRLMLLLGFAP